MGAVDAPREQAHRKLREPQRFAELKRRYSEWEERMLQYPERQWPGIRAVKSKFRNLD
jgi:hypothetical protein